MAARRKKTSTKKTARKKAPSTRAVAKPASRGVAPSGLAEKYAAQAQAQQVSTPRGGGNFLQRITADKQKFSLTDGEGRAYYTDSFEAVILMGRRVNRHTPGTYDPNDPQPPDCVAIADYGKPDSSMAPIEGWLDYSEGNGCSDCPNNPRGGRKACRNGIDVAVVPLPELDKLQDGESPVVYKHTISSMGIQPFSEYLATIQDDNGAQLPPFTVVTTLLRDTNKGYDITRCEAGDWLDEDTIDALAELIEDVDEKLTNDCRPFAPVEEEGDEEEDEKPAARGRGRRRSVGSGRL